VTTTCAATKRFGGIVCCFARNLTIREDFAPKPRHVQWTPHKSDCAYGVRRRLKGRSSRHLLLWRGAGSWAQRRLSRRIRRPTENFRAQAVLLALYVGVRAIDPFSVFIMPFSIAVLEFDSFITSRSSLLPSRSVGGLLRQFPGGKRLRKNIADFISPTAVMFDDLISNVRHIRLSFSALSKGPHAL
jgi:hypothetical protein